MDLTQQAELLQDLPSEIPVMVLPECHLFPGCLLPLYIFEHRYRKMLEDVLANQRIFCIANRIGETEDEISFYSTAGIVRACVKQDDGTSHLLLMGLRRIKLLGWKQMHPYRIARIEPLQTVTGSLNLLEKLKEQTLNLFKPCAETESLRTKLMLSDDFELVADILSYHFTRCPELQQRLLAEPSIEQRYRMIYTALKEDQCH